MYVADPRPFVSDEEVRVLRAFARLGRPENPFLAERVADERAALGDAFVASTAVWHAGTLDNPNLARLGELAGLLARDLRERLVKGARATRDQLQLYGGLIYYLLYDLHQEDFFGLIQRAERGESSSGRLPFYAHYVESFEHFLQPPGVSLPLDVDAPRLLAFGFQVRRAFHLTFRQIYGGSMPAARLRAAVWSSIFTHDPERYRRALYERMSDIPTLIVGESGTGKELVARAIGLSRYIPFDAARGRFAESYLDTFHPLNLSALSPTLIESELFGHRRGSFTGAVEDRSGWLEVCGDHGAIFLDEIGELDVSIQVKLLRVLQDRVFQRIGETGDREFRGKIIAATNLDLDEELSGGRFRRDLYYRLCADVVRTPGLREQLAEDPGELERLVLILARRIVGDDEAESLTSDVVDWIESHLSADYAWPGNVRELEQCVRSILVRKEYTPARDAREPGAAGGVAATILRGEATADELLREYCTRVYASSGSYEEAARRLGLDRRTVKARLDQELLAELRAGSAEASRRP